MMRKVVWLVIGLSLVALVTGLSLAQGQGQEKVTICHHANDQQVITITVGAPAVNAHLQHGDTLGACPGTPTRAPVN
jgi:hypothetical protein